MKPSFDLCLQEHEVECMRYNYIHEINCTASVKRLAITYKNEKLKLEYVYRMQ